MPDDQPRKPPPQSAEELLERYAEGERDFHGIDLRGGQLGNAYLACADFHHASFDSANLHGANLRKADLHWTGLSHASLVAACLRDADATTAFFEGSLLGRADFTDANCRRARFIGADLSGADLTDTNLMDCDLRDANLSGATLRRTNLSGAVLLRAVITDVLLEGIGLGAVDLSQVTGLADVNHKGPSHVALDTLAVSNGRIPNSFLKGCGLADWEILNAKLYDPDLTALQIADLQAEVFRLRADSPIQISPIYISYSHADSAFVEALERLFDTKGIRYWRDVHDMKAGRMKTQIERAITLNPTVLIVLSEDSVESDWVEWEVSKGRELEKKSGRDVLCPVALDDSWKTCSWPGPLRRQIEDYHVLDFRDWKDEVVMKRQMAKLWDGLRLFYEGSPPTDT